jgi:excinuclease ABC subunit C
VLSERLEFIPQDDEALFTTVPATPAIFVLRSDEPQSEPYITKTANLRRRLQRLLGKPTEQTKRLNLREVVRWIEYTTTGSDFESGFQLYRALRAYFPRTYAARLRLRFAPLVKLHLENEYPRASVTTRLGRISGRSCYYGPFPSRPVAEKFCNDSLDFFKMRRCVDDLKPDPQFPGCIYSEMKMCLAPCFKGCTDDEYVHEVDRVKAYFETGGESLVREISTQRDQASTDLHFEDAASLHTRLEKLKPVLAQLPEIVHRIDQLIGVMVQPSSQAGAVTFFRIHAGRLSGPVNFSIQSADHAKSQSMESRIEQSLVTLPPAETKTALETMEHLAILKRWYYRGTRVGEVFFADAKGTLPMRRLVRGISRVYRGETPEDVSATKQQGQAHEKQPG